MRILLDENVHVKLMDRLIKLGHETVRVPSGLKNGQVMELAIRESRILLTQDKDFANRLMYPPKQYPGIIILRIHPPELDRLTSALRAFLGDLGNVSLKGKLAIVEERGYQLQS